MRRVLPLETPRLVLRPPGDHDVSLVLAGFRANAARLGRSGDETLTRTATWITGECAAWEHDERYSFLVLANERPELCGHVALSDVLRGGRQSASLGFWIDEDVEGRGFATEAIGAVLAYAFGPLGLARIDAAVVPDHTRSQRVLERVGFQREGIARGYLAVDGLRTDHVIYARLRDDR